MPDGHGLALSLRSEEYAVLGGILGATTLMGLADPFAGLLADEVRTRLAAIRQEMQRQGLIHLRPDNRALVHPVAGALLSACVFPEVALMATVNRPGWNPEQAYFFAGSQGTVRMRQHGGTVDLLQLPGLDNVGTAVRALLALPDIPEADLPGGEVDRPTLDQAARAAADSGSESAQSVLTGTGLPAETAAALALALSEPILNGSVALLWQTGRGWKTAGFGILADQSVVWRLDAIERDGTKRVAMTTSSAAGIHEAIDRLVGQHLLERLPTWAPLGS